MQNITHSLTMKWTVVEVLGTILPKINSQEFWTKKEKFIFIYCAHCDIWAWLGRFQIYFNTIHNFM